MNTSSQLNGYPHPEKRHEEIVPLLDAYSTGELEQQEQEAVEFHLTHCQECRDLIILTYLLVNKESSRNGNFYYLNSDTICSSSPQGCPGKNFNRN